MTPTLRITVSECPGGYEVTVNGCAASIESGDRALRTSVGSIAVRNADLGAALEQVGRMFYGTLITPLLDGVQGGR